MRFRTAILVGLVVGLGPGLLAQEPEAPSAPEEKRNAARQIRVLKHPYDIASFYRAPSSPAGYYGGLSGFYGGAWSPYLADPSGFYRSGPRGSFPGVHWAIPPYDPDARPHPRPGSDREQGRVVPRQ